MRALDYFRNRNFERIQIAKDVAAVEVLPWEVPSLRRQGENLDRS